MAPKIDKSSSKRGFGSCLGSMSWPRWRPRWPRGALRGSKMANLVPRCGNIAPKKPPDAAKIAILGACWELVGSIFCDLACFLVHRLQIKKHRKINDF